MDYLSINNALSNIFFENFKPAKSIKSHDIQFKIFTLSVLSIMLENAFGFSKADVIKIQHPIGYSLNKEIESSREIMNGLLFRGYNEKNLFTFFIMEMITTTRKADKIRRAMAAGNLGSAMTELNEVLYLLYMAPLEGFDSMGYFEIFPNEFFKYKDIFLIAYTRVSERMRETLENSLPSREL